MDAKTKITESLDRLDARDPMVAICEEAIAEAYRVFGDAKPEN